MISESEGGGMWWAWEEQCEQALPPPLPKLLPKQDVCTASSSPHNRAFIKGKRNFKTRKGKQKKVGILFYSLFCGYVKPQIFIRLYGGMHTCAGIQVKHNFCLGRASFFPPPRKKADFSSCLAHLYTCTGHVPGFQILLRGNLRVV